MALKLPPGVLNKIKKVEDAGHYNLPANRLDQIFQEGSQRMRREMEIGTGWERLGKTNEFGRSQPFDYAAFLADTWLQGSGMDWSDLGLQEKQDLLNSAWRYQEAMNRDQGPLGFMTKAEFAIPAILTAGVGAGLAGAGAGTGSVGANIGGTTVGASGGAGAGAGAAAGGAAAGNAIPAAYGGGTTQVTAQTAGAPQFLGSTAGYGAGGSLSAPAIAGNPVNTATKLMNTISEVDPSTIPGSRTASKSSIDRVLEAVGGGSQSDNIMDILFGSGPGEGLVGGASTIGAGLANRNYLDNQIEYLRSLVTRPEDNPFVQTLYGSDAAHGGESRGYLDDPSSLMGPEGPYGALADYYLQSAERAAAREGKLPGTGAGGALNQGAVDQVMKTLAAHVAPLYPQTINSIVGGINPYQGPTNVALNTMGRMVPQRTAETDTAISGLPETLSGVGKTFRTIFDIFG